MDWVPVIRIDKDEETAIQEFNRVITPVSSEVIKEA